MKWACAPGAFYAPWCEVSSDVCVGFIACVGVVLMRVGDNWEHMWFPIIPERSQTILFLGIYLVSTSGQKGFFQGFVVLLLLLILDNYSICAVLFGWFVSSLVC